MIDPSFSQVVMTLKAVPVDFDSKWAGLGNVCQKVIRCEPVANDLWCNSFSDVYALCVSRPNSQAFRLYESVTEVLRQRIMEILNEISNDNDDTLLVCYNHHWSIFHRGLQFLDNLLKYMPL